MLGLVCKRAHRFMPIKTMHERFGRDCKSRPALRVSHAEPVEAWRCSPPFDRLRVTKKTVVFFSPPSLVILGCAASEDLVRFSVKQKEILEAYGFKGDGWFFLRMASKNRRIFQF
jgi:hypothetical protein